MHSLHIRVETYAHSISGFKMKGKTMCWSQIFVCSYTVPIKLINISLKFM